MSARSDILRLALQVVEDTSEKPTPNLHQFLLHWNSIDEMEARFTDDLSRSLFRWYMAVRLASEMNEANKFKRLRVFRGIHTEKRWQDYRERAETLMNTKDGTVSENTDEVIETNILDGYIIKGEVEPREGEVVLDIGSFNGNNAIQFSNYVGATGRVYTFEPNPDLFPDVVKNCKPNPNITPVNVGFAEAEKEVEFALEGPRTRPVVGNVKKKKTRTLKLRRLDDFVESEKLERVDFLKFDIEGSEVPALTGAARTIRNFRPTCMVAIYHKPTDLYRIPKLIDPYGLWYDFKLRHYHWLPREMVLFAIPKSQAVPGYP
ncbi:FkbM family methyltransferase [Pseudoruegeria sp. HB172150]|uniref:FkbM family methyltransferase n=1 Tax=Pseudoruegeria sp. HB172150 TaxID=2721164 RepID=UPI0015517145|nr:FkbM family methyltransferase [Pseudoruegeria sp. HB172150]